MEIAAREAKRRTMQELRLQEHEIGAIYLTPCPAKMIALKDPPRKQHSFLDGAIPIAEIYASMLQVLRLPDGINNEPDIHGLGLGWPILGGQVACLKAEERIAVGGLTDVMRVFDEIENGKLKHIQYIECHSCPTGCVGGSLTVENPYIARARVLRMIDQYGSGAGQDRQKIRDLYRSGFFSLAGTIAPSPVQPLDEDISKAIHKMHRRNQIFEGLPKIDCGACGAPTCLTFAADVVKGDAEADECVFLAMKALESKSKALLELIERQNRNIRARLGGRDHDA
jgi:hypothetical protein